MDSRGGSEPRLARMVDACEAELIEIKRRQRDLVAGRGLRGEFGGRERSREIMRREIALALDGRRTSLTEQEFDEAVGNCGPALATVLSTVRASSRKDGDLSD